MIFTLKILKHIKIFEQMKYQSIPSFSFSTPLKLITFATDSPLIEFKNE